MTTLAAIVVITNIGFTVAYDTDAAGPSWCAYDLEPCEVIKEPRPSFAFKSDDRIGCTNVTRTFFGYDRGHLAPAADFHWNTNAMRETFLLSNVSPMTARLNRGPWRRTEDEVRSLAASGTVHVVIWPEYASGQIPFAFHKVAYGWFGIRHWHFENRMEKKLWR